MRRALLLAWMVCLLVRNRVWRLQSRWNIWRLKRHIARQGIRIGD